MVFVISPSAASCFELLLCIDLTLVEELPDCHSTSLFVFRSIQTLIWFLMVNQLRRRSSFGPNDINWTLYDLDTNVYQEPLFCVLLLTISVRSSRLM
ncbi:hypothetical protein Taro_014628 [Colocasia esculenta]|uniref:Uncharacterized protein n=1 Tax=Colocasia esculenta TaxID=4460 RepID=A0A843UME3_COLES|nr:hypothetical protein [Colocasia esculenta]